VFVKPLVANQHWTLTQVSANFTIALAFLGLGTVVGGLWMDRVGPRMVATAAGVFYGLGYIVASVGVAHSSLVGLYIG
jgi:OFA family oxalate/formate antiporter-like MFS transporter